jgi:molecular chaperone GrpE
MFKLACHASAGNAAFAGNLLESPKRSPIFWPLVNWYGLQFEKRCPETMEFENVKNKRQNPFEQAVEVDVEQTVIPGEGDAVIEAPLKDVVDDELQGMNKAVSKAEEELVMHRDAMLRMQAEMENLRKRLIRDQEKSRKFALERVMKDLLQVRDSLERGLETGGEATTAEQFREGQTLTLKMLDKVMQDHDLELVDPAGEKFDPEFHQAMTVMPSAELEEDTVMEVLQKGFKLHDRLIRPAMVVVSRKP